MNPIMNMLGSMQSKNGAQNRNVMMSAMFAMMRGQSPQDFLKTIPELNGVDLSNIEGAAQKICSDRGVNYEDAKQMVSSQLKGMK